MGHRCDLRRARFTIMATFSVVLAISRVSRLVARKWRTSRFHHFGRRRFMDDILRAYLAPAIKEQAKMFGRFDFRPLFRRPRQPVSQAFTFRF